MPNLSNTVPPPPNLPSGAPKAPQPRCGHTPASPREVSLAETGALNRGVRARHAHAGHAGEEEWSSGNALQGLSAAPGGTGNWADDTSMGSATGELYSATAAAEPADDEPDQADEAEEDENESEESSQAAEDSGAAEDEEEEEEDESEVDD